MSRLDWIVCERTNRWSAALRMQLARQAGYSDTTTASSELCEVRSLAELSSRLAVTPSGLAAIEVCVADFGDVLTWLADAQRRFPHARFMALLDRSLTPRPGTAIAALREAGACHALTSPRHWAAAVPIAQRHAAISAARATVDGQSTPVDLIWAALPWQGSASRVG